VTSGRDSSSAEPAAPAGREGHGFDVHLSVFDGPFDLLLGLISKRKLDVTEVALSQVTDDFLAHIRAFGPEWDLGQATEFLVVAATLLDLKAARLLPSGEVEDEEDLALLEARDLLFARLLQYRAYKEAAAVLAQRLTEESRRYPRTVGLDERFVGLLPEVLLGLGPVEFAALAARTLAPRAVPTVPMAHLHAPLVSVREQANLLVARLVSASVATFRALSADCPDTLTVVARFLALLELYREGAVTFDQVSPLGELVVRWTGTQDAGLGEMDEFDGVIAPEVSEQSHAADRADAEVPTDPADAGDPGDPAPVRLPPEGVST
jgi:segregation and condensation protein A